ncbi:glycoside hydrolase family 16 protein [Chitinophaga sp.]|uniref:glycoside hydrolase family 16 protein n=1 Tax=Chitinophaga sp. TaxID=1869181 RepID=UPI002DB9679F|nr:glycoside hydrolase family 16 protein [Chitinophaga sp.]
MQKAIILAITLATLASCSKHNDMSIEKPGTATGAKKATPINAAAERTIRFSSINWTVRNESGTSGPDDNYWSNSTNNVWVDANGYLHMKIRKDAATGRWYCAEVISQQSFGYGSYIWKIEGRVDQLDKNIVFGLFNYKAGDDGHHEVDIEFARWGNNAWPNYNYTVYPATGDPDSNAHHEFELALNGTYSMYKFYRTSTSVSFRGFHGHVEDNNNSFFPWTTPAGFPVSTLALPVHMNLWLYKHLPPSNGQEVELIIHEFIYQPL